MFANITKLKTLLLFLCLSLVVVACGDDDDSSTNPTDTKKVTVDLEDVVEAQPRIFKVAINEPTDSLVVKAYIGDFHQNNYFATLGFGQDATKQNIATITLGGDLRSEYFIAYKNLNYDGLECVPENLARSTSHVRFFEVKDDQKGREFVIASKTNEDDTEFDKQYELYYWGSDGTATGIEIPYKVDYNVSKGWNITEKSGENLITIPNIQGEVYLFPID